MDDDDDFTDGHYDPDKDPDLDDRDDPLPDDMDEETDPEALIGTIDCPYCNEEIHADAQRCPNCGSYISQEDAPASRKPIWIIVGLILVALILLTWIGFKI